MLPCSLIGTFEMAESVGSWYQWAVPGVLNKLCRNFVSIAVPAVQMRPGKDWAKPSLVLLAPNLHCRHCDRSSNIDATPLDRGWWSLGDIWCHGLARGKGRCGVDHAYFFLQAPGFDGQPWIWLRIATFPDGSTGETAVCKRRSSAMKQRISNSADMVWSPCVPRCASKLVQSQCQILLFKPCQQGVKIGRQWKSYDYTILQ